MDHKVTDWMSSPVIVIDAESTVAYAINKMRRRNIHCLVIIVAGQPVQYGILTTVDIRDKVLALSKNPAKVSVSKVMTFPVVSVSSRATVQDCAVVMKESVIDHLPVMDDSGDLIGLISTSDLLVAAGEINWDEDFYNK
jgi:CBS domain-containing protein